MSDEKPTSTAIAPIGAIECSISTSLSVQSKEDRDTLANALTGEDDKLANMVGKTLAVRDYVVHSVTMLDNASGEYTQGTRIVLIDPKGKRYSCVSMGVMQALRTFIGIYGVAPWDPPLRVCVTEGKSRQGFRFLSLGIVTK